MYDRIGIAKEEKKPNLLQVIMSVAAAAIGIQTDANYRRDFKHGSPVPFIIGGMVFTALFVLAVLGVVMLALPS